MRLLWLTENYPPQQGGMAQSCDRIVENLRTKGVQIDVLHLTDRVVPFVSQQQLNGVYYPVPRHSDISHCLNVVLSYVEHHLSAIQYDALVAFGGHYPVVAAPVYAKLLRLPLCLCFRGNDFDVALFDAKRRAALDDAVTNSATIFVGSRQKQQRIKALYPTAEVNYTPSSIDVSNWQALSSEASFANQWRKENVRAGDCVIGLLGFMKRKKGVGFFLNAVRQSGAKVHLVLSKEQNDEQAEVITELLQAYSIRHSIIPAMTRYELIKYYVACDWLAIPSYYEGMPNAMLEAGALGVPVIASNVDGMRDVISHSENGLLFRPLDRNDCATAICSAANLPSTRRQQMGEALKLFIVQQLTPSHEAQSYLSVLERLNRIDSSNIPDVADTSNSGVRLKSI